MKSPVVDSESFAPTMQFEKLEITVFVGFPNFYSGQNISLTTLVDGIIDSIKSNS